MTQPLTKYQVNDQVVFQGRVWTVKEVGSRRRPNRHLQPMYLLQSPYQHHTRKGCKPVKRFTYTYQPTATIRRA